MAAFITLSRPVEQRDLRMFRELREIGPWSVAAKPSANPRTLGNFLPRRPPVENLSNRRHSACLQGPHCPASRGTGTGGRREHH